MTESNKNGQTKTPSITARQERAIHALLAGQDDAAAAQAAGVTRPTVNRWKNHDADFQAAMNTARAELADGFLDGLRALYPDAIAALRDGLNPENTPAVRLRAAEAIIKNIAPPDGETDAEAIRARWATKHAEVAREQEVARFSMPLTAMLD